MKKIVLVGILSLIFNNLLFSQGATCASADPFCTNLTYTFPNNTGTTAETGNNYGCLSTQPNPAWYFMEVATSGNIVIGISQTNTGGTGIDVDYILYGPYTSTANAISNCGNMGNGTTNNSVIDCSYSTAATETATITNAVAGQVYMMLLTNYADEAGTIDFSQSGGTGATNCNILVPCVISALTVTAGACQVATNTYTVSGSITFTDMPTTGTLTVTDCHGNSQVFNAPFTSPKAYSISGIPSNGAACNVTAVFSDNSSCTRTTNYTAPAACTCLISALTAVPGACIQATSTYTLTGAITFANAPASGTLTVTDCHGGTQVFNAPFTSPQAYSIAGINSNGVACNATAVFSANPTCTLIKNYTSPAACTVSCAISGVTATTTACDGSGNYTTSGQITFTNPPATGNLVIEDCNGIQQTIAAGSISSPQAYNLSNQTANGLACDITAYFSTNAACTQTLAYTAPGCNCNIDLFQAQQGFCDGPSNSFELTGSIEYSFPPVSGTLTITANNGTTNFDTIINAPFISPQTWGISGIPANGSNITITATFSSNAGCTASLNTVAPPDCSCPANIGTFNTTIIGDGQNNYQLCFGDILEIQSNNNYTFSNIASAPPAPAPYGYNPGIGYLMYSCPPTIGTVPSADTSQVISNDPCFLGVVSFGDDYNVLNNIGAVGAPFTNSTVYYVPITFYDTLNGLYSYTNTNITCFSMGIPFSVQYLSEVLSSSPTENCAAGSFTVTVNGGLPELNGSIFTASNLLPLTASFVNNTTTEGGSIQINGLQNGDMYSFDVADANGCPIIITGGPFVGIPTANAGLNDTTCTLTYNLNAIPSIGTGIWTGPPNISFSPNATTANATATSNTIGTYTLTWTETNTPGCIDTATVNITFTQLSIPNVLTNINCNGGQDGQVVVAPQGGLLPYTYSWNTSANTTPVETNLSAGSITVRVTDISGCFLDSTFILTQPSAFGLTITSSTPLTCKGGNDGQATANVADIIDTYTYSWNATPTQNTAIATNLTVGTFTVVATQTSSGCTDTATVIISEPTAVTISSISPNISICSSQSTNITATATGGSGAGYVYTWNNGLGVGQNHTVTPVANSTTIYQVTAIDGNGCISNTGSVTVTVYPNLSVIASVDQSICPSTSTTISATPSNGNGGPYNYIWTPNTNINSTTAQSPIVTPIVTTTYYVTLSDGCSPTVRDSVKVSLWNLPNPQASSDTLSLCIQPSQSICSSHF